MVGAGASIFLPPWTKNWVTAWDSKRVTTLGDSVLISITAPPLPRGRSVCLREFLAGVDSLALAVEVLVPHAVRVVIATICVALAGEAVVGVGTTASARLTDVILVGGAGMRGQGIRVRVRLPIFIVSLLGAARGRVCEKARESYQTSISAQQAPYGPTPALASLEDGFQPSMLA